jgi:hypothetical protein
MEPKYRLPWFTTRHWYLTWHDLNLLTTITLPHSIILGYIVILSSHVRLHPPSGIFPTDFLVETSYSYLSLIRSTRLTHPWFDRFIWRGVQITNLFCSVLIDYRLPDTEGWRVPLIRHTCSRKPLFWPSAPFGFPWHSRVEIPRINRM